MKEAVILIESDKNAVYLTRHLIITPEWLKERATSNPHH